MGTQLFHFTQSVQIHKECSYVPTTRAFSYHTHQNKFFRISWAIETLGKAQPNPCETRDHKVLDTLPTLIPNIIENVLGNFTSPLGVKQLLDMELCDLLKGLKNQALFRYLGTDEFYMYTAAKTSPIQRRGFKTAINKISSIIVSTKNHISFLPATTLLCLTLGISYLMTQKGFHTIKVGIRNGHSGMNQCLYWGKLCLEELVNKIDQELTLPEEEKAYFSECWWSGLCYSLETNNILRNLEDKLDGIEKDIILQEAKLLEGAGIYASKWGHDSSNSCTDVYNNENQQPLPPPSYHAVIDAYYSEYDTDSDSDMEMNLNSNLGSGSSFDLRSMSNALETDEEYDEPLEMQKHHLNSSIGDFLIEVLDTLDTDKGEFDNSNSSSNLRSIFSELWTDDEYDDPLKLESTRTLDGSFEDLLSEVIDTLESTEGGISRLFHMPIPNLHLEHTLGGDKEGSFANKRRGNSISKLNSNTTPWGY